MRVLRCLIFTRRVLLSVGCILSVSWGALSQTSSGQQLSNGFVKFFRELPKASGSGGSRGEAAFEALESSIRTLTPAQVAAGLLVINSELDSTVQPEDRLAKADAALLLVDISTRPDGTALLQPEINRLATMLKEPSHFLSGPAILAFQPLRITEPDVVRSIFEEALTSPGMGSLGSPGPGIVGTLVEIAPMNEETVGAVVGYMRRPDLDQHQLIATIMSVNSSPTIPSALTAEFVRCLDNPSQYVKSRALVGIARSSPAARGAARTRVQRMANDISETPHVRRLAAEALQGEITESPNPPQ